MGTFMNENKIIDSLVTLSREMQEHWEPETLFRTVMKCYGTANTSIERALKNDRAINMASETMDESMLRPDVMIPNRVYFRFLKHDEDVREALDTVIALPEFKHPKAHLQFALCAGPSLISVYDAVTEGVDTFKLEDLASHYAIFLPLTGTYQRPLVKEGAEADARACGKLTQLLDDLARANHIDDVHRHALNDFIRRVLFCLFAEDTGIFEENQFTQAFSRLTDKQGSNARQFFTDLFEVLDTPQGMRDRMGRVIPAEILAFPYVNGGLFRYEDETFVPEFNIATRSQLLDSGRLQWHEISPAIFGSMFQSALDPAHRREMGAHYTSEENILKIINPLFMDDLREEFQKIREMPDNNSRDARRRRDALMALQDKMASLKFLDPACGCGNFLIIAYRELRRLENELLEELFPRGSDAFIDVSTAIKVQVDQFFGIEIEDWPAEIAHLSMWLMMHALNKETGEKLGHSIPSIPLKRSANIVCANALTTDWNEVLKASECSYVLGNPPFGGALTVKKEQKEWLRGCYPPKYKIDRADYCTAWYVKTADYMEDNKLIHAGLVATNSICQGQQVDTLWSLLFKKGIQINFAYPSFAWDNSGKGGATVTCVIIGFSYFSKPARYLYQQIDHVFKKERVLNISPYLTDSASSVIVRRSNTPLAAKLNLTFGNMPADGGTLLLDATSAGEFMDKYPECRAFLKCFIGSEELINGTFRYCWWLNEENREVWKNISVIMQQVEACRKYRESAVKTGDAYKLRLTPWSFREQKNPPTALVIPAVSSERRPYIPMDMIDDKTIVSNAAFLLANASHYDFGILTSRMHACWMRLTAGRLESRYRYSRDLTYNTFIWPEATDEDRERITKLAQEILLVRADYYDKNLAFLYNPDTMPPELKEAHAALDRAVEALYRPEPFKDDEERTAFMLDLYAKAIARKEETAK